MNLVTKATNSIATQAKGAFANCGGSDGYELSYSCRGPACSSLDVNFQDVVCHKDGSSRLICSNAIKCPHNTSPYQSNFTFSQNEPDPWSPVMDNKPDTWVHQDQHVLVGSCARFSLTSDGTRDGTRVHDEGQAGVCPNIQGLPTSLADSSVVGAISSTSPPHVSATNKPSPFEGKSSRRTISKSTVLFAFIFGIVLLLPGSQASTVHQHLEQPRQMTDIHMREVFGGVRSFAEDFKVELAQKINSQGTDGEIFAHNLVADIVSSVCQGYFDGAKQRSFTPAIVQGCIASIYGGDQLLPSATRFLAIFGASLVCDYVVSETYPNGRDFLPGRCEELRDLTSKIPTKASTAISSAPSIPSSSTRNTFVGALHTGGPLSDEQASNRPEDALSQTTAQGTSSSDFHSLSTLLAGTTPSSLTDLSSAESSGHTVSVPLPMPLSELPPAELSSSNPISTEASSGTSVQTESFAAEKPPLGSFTSGGLSIGSAAKTGSITASQDASLIPLRSTQSIYGLPEQGTEGNSRTPVNTADSKPVSPLSASSDSFTSMVPSRTGSAVSAHRVFAVSLAPHSATVGSSRTSSRSDASQPSATSILIVPSLPTPLSDTSATNTPISSSYLTSASYSIPSPSSSSFLSASRSSMNSLDIPTPSRPMSEPSQLETGTSINSDSDLSSVMTAEPVSVVIGVQSPSRGSTTSSEPSVPTQVSASFAKPLVPSKANSVSFISPEALPTPDSPNHTPSSDTQRSKPSLASPITPALFSAAKSLSLEAVSSNEFPTSDSEALPSSSHELNASRQTFGSSTNIQTRQGLQSSVEVTTVVSASTNTSSFTTSPLGAFVSLATESRLSASKSPPRLGVQQVSRSLERSTSHESSATVSVNNVLAPSAAPVPHSGSVTLLQASAVTSPLVTTVFVSTALASTFSVDSSESSESLRIAPEPIVDPASASIGPFSTIQGAFAELSEVIPLTTKNATSAQVKSLFVSSTPGSSLASSEIGVKISAVSAIVLLSVSTNEELPPIATATLGSSSRPSTSVYLKVGSVLSRSVSNPIVIVVSITTASSRLSSTSVASPSLNMGISSIPDDTLATLINYPSFAPSSTIRLTQVTNSAISSVDSRPDLASSCIHDSATPDFCPSSGCVSLMADEAHCGACDHACEHVCYQGACVCPDLTVPDADNLCVSKPGLGQCLDGFTRNAFRVCASLPTPTPLGTSFTTTERSALELTTQMPTVSSSSTLISSVVVLSTNTPSIKSVQCPFELPDICNSACFNTRSEHNHCGGCGRYCSGTCINGSCYTSSTQPGLQPISTQQEVTTSSLPSVPPALALQTLTAEAVAFYILRGMDG